MRKLIIILILFTGTAHTQEFSILNYVKDRYKAKDYENVIEYLNKNLEPEKIQNHEILAKIYLYYSLAHFKTGKEYLAIPKILELFKLNPEFQIDTKIFKKDEIDFFNLIRQENLSSIRVTTVPDSADVFMDNNYKGKTPLIINNILTGKYTIFIVKDQFNMVSEDIYIEPEIANKFQKTLSWNGLASLFVNSEPPGAELFVEEIYKGLTPLFLSELSRGKYRFTLRKKHFKDFEDDFEIPYENKNKITIRLQKRKDYFFYSLLIPGFGQYMMGNYYHGALSFGLFAGTLAYLRNHIKSQPVWLYKDREIEAVPVHGPGADYIYKIDGIIVDKDTFLPVWRAKKEEEKQRSSFSKKKQKIQIFCYLFYTLNIFDTIYLIKRQEDVPVNLSFIARKDYAGIEIKVGW